MCWPKQNIKKNDPPISQAKSERKTNVTPADQPVDYPF